MHIAEAAHSVADAAGTRAIILAAGPGLDIIGFGQPWRHVRTLETSQFHVAGAAALQDPIAVLYVPAHLNDGNQALIELKSQLQAGQPHSEIGKTVEKMEGGGKRWRRP